MKGFLVSSALVISATAAFAADPSSFQNARFNIAFHYTDDGGAEIAATCLTADGMPHDTSITMPGIGNDNGSLVIEGGSASFQKSCGSIMLHPSIDGVELTASCRKTDGSFEDASISIDGISNENGTLSD
ncbi:CVNH domain-containing protein [Rhodovulum sulfidophilum]|uniref:CVNH domain-containing protein n=1 Tax=Rhodovulum sulfidophilum TaxID=35806 RepID=UPI0019221634|nr:CVNH domain-containing protein [Rhodovulum sulfidophilum]MBL3572437.1 CVNH domain-containing protein [Rhodovulum sulfidophilum]MCE8432307.1 CVNH domain-containing protein [Rhodovulum sulfidophilum]MCF4116514.1 CVNH domain-containing protein [Rhodovulum sulfidophilum]